MTLAPKILVADDDQALSRTLSWILKENGYDVLTVPGGEHLFEHLQAEPFDLLLLDIMMPKVDGLQLLQRVKADPRFKDLPVLMISSMPPEEATVRSLGLGAADFIPKPFRVRELLARVKAHLRVGRELNQARAEARSRSEMMDIMQEVTASLKPEEIYQILVRRVAQGLNISRCSIVIAGPDDETGTVVAAFENPMLHNLPVDLEQYPEIRHALDDRRGGAGPRRDDRSAVRARSGTAGTAERQAGADPVRHRAPVLAPAGSRPASSSSGPPPRTRRSTSRTSQFAEQVIDAAVAALEKAYDLENAVHGPGADAAPGGDRPAHQLLQPPRADGEAGAGDGPRRPLRHDAHRHDDRHRQLQADQRHPRPPGGRPGAQAAGQPAQAGAAVGGHRGALRRRGVRGAAAGDHQSPSRATSPSASCAGSRPTTSASRASRCG